ncbi:hypothetical protein FKM82_002863 [Ascaphus truei]
MGILEKISEIEKEIARTQKNKATEYHLGLLKAKLAKYRSQLLEPPKSAAGKGDGFDVMKSGDARVALIGFPSVGKYKGANIQLLDSPGGHRRRIAERPDFSDAIILRKGASVEHVCHRVHRTLASQFKYALVWGTSTKYSPQRVGLSHNMEHEDVIQIVKK